MKFIAFDRFDGGEVRLLGADRGEFLVTNQLRCHNETDQCDQE